MSRLRTLLLRRSLLRRLLFTTSSLPILMTAYEVPPNAINSAVVAATFEYDKCFRSELSTARFLLFSGPRQSLQARQRLSGGGAAVRRRSPRPSRCANCHR